MLLLNGCPGGLASWLLLIDDKPSFVIVLRMIRLVHQSPGQLRSDLQLNPAANHEAGRKKIVKAQGITGSWTGPDV